MQSMAWPATKGSVKWASYNACMPRVKPTLGMERPLVYLQNFKNPVRSERLCPFLHYPNKWLEVPIFRHNQKLPNAIKMCVSFNLSKILQFREIHGTGYHTFSKYSHICRRPGALTVTDFHLNKWWAIADLVALDMTMFPCAFVNFNFFESPWNLD